MGIVGRIGAACAVVVLSGCQTATTSQSQAGWPGNPRKIEIIADSEQVTYPFLIPNPTLPSSERAVIRRAGHAHYACPLKGCSMQLLYGGVEVGLFVINKDGKGDLANLSSYILSAGDPRTVEQGSSRTKNNSVFSYLIQNKTDRKIGFDKQNIRIALGFSGIGERVYAILMTSRNGDIYPQNIIENIESIAVPAS